MDWMGRMGRINMHGQFSLSGSRLLPSPGRRMGCWMGIMGLTAILSIRGQVWRWFSYCNRLLMILRCPAHFPPYNEGMKFHRIPCNASYEWRSSFSPSPWLAICLAIRVGTFPFNDQSMTIQTFWMFNQPKLHWPVKETCINCDKNYVICTIFRLNLEEKSKLK